MSEMPNMPNSNGVDRNLDAYNKYYQGVKKVDQRITDVGLFPNQSQYITQNPGDYISNNELFAGSNSRLAQLYTQIENNPNIIRLNFKPGDTIPAMHIRSNVDGLNYSNIPNGGGNSSVSNYTNANSSAVGGSAVSGSQPSASDKAAVKLSRLNQPSIGTFGTVQGYWGSEPAGKAYISDAALDTAAFLSRAVIDAKFPNLSDEEKTGLSKSMAVFETSSMPKNLFTKAGVQQDGLLKHFALKYGMDINGKLAQYMLEEEKDTQAMTYLNNLGLTGEYDLSKGSQVKQALEAKGCDSDTINRVLGKLNDQDANVRGMNYLSEHAGESWSSPYILEDREVKQGVDGLKDIMSEMENYVRDNKLGRTELERAAGMPERSTYNAKVDGLLNQYKDSMQSIVDSGKWNNNTAYMRGLFGQADAMKNILQNSDSPLFHGITNAAEKKSLTDIAVNLLMREYGDGVLAQGGKIDGLPDLFEQRFGIKLTDQQKQGLKAYSDKSNRSPMSFQFTPGYGTSTPDPVGMLASENYATIQAAKQQLGDNPTDAQLAAFEALQNNYVAARGAVFSSIPGHQ